MEQMTDYILFDHIYTEIRLYRDIDYIYTLYRDDQIIQHTTIDVNGHVYVIFWSIYKTRLIHLYYSIIPTRIYTEYNKYC